MIVTQLLLISEHMFIIAAGLIYIVAIATVGIQL